MKILIQLILFLLSVYPINLICQDTTETNQKTPNFLIGLKLISEKSGNYITPQTIMVFNGGVQIIRKTNYKLFSIETGLYSITKAIVLRDDLYSLTKTFDIRYRNLSVPFNCRFDNKFIYISFGPNFDYLIKQDFSNWIVTSYSDLRKFWIGANLNLGLKFKINNHKFIFIEGRYSRGLITLNKNYFRYEPNFTNYGLAIGYNSSLPKWRSK